MRQQHGIVTRLGSKIEVPVISDHIATSVKKPKKLNLSTYKLHAIGNYSATICQYGTVDSYSTQIVSSRILYIMSYIVITHSG
jgi:ribosomal protein L6P/L9E